MKGRDFDRVFDGSSQDIINELDLSTARRPGREVRRVRVDFPVWMVESLDAEAVRLGVTRPSVITTWIAERLDR
jgi:hypothetical protein